MTPTLPPDPTTVTAAFLDTAARRGDRAALRWREGQGFAAWTWRDYADRVARVAAALASLGLSRGERLVLLLPNMPEFHVADTATVFCGATPISLYNSSSPEQIAYLAGHCRAAVVVAHAGALDRVLAVRDRLPELRHVVVVGGAAPPGTLTWEQLLAAAPADLAAAAERVSPDDLATVIYTSGTTGAPKGVMITHRNVAAEYAAGAQFWPGPEQSMVSYLPMAHIAERMLSHYLHIILGTEVTTCPEIGELGFYLTQVRPHTLFGPPRVWEKLHAGLHAALAAAPPERQEEFRAALRVGREVQLTRARGEALPPPLAERWAAVDAAAFAPVRALVGLDRCQIAFSGAAPIPAEVITFFRDIGVPMSEIYGMSENTGGMTWDPFAVRPGTVGRALPGVQLRLAEDGELLCRGPIVFPGYLDDPVRTEEALDADGWLHTGDIAEIDADGYVRIVDRKKELIITAGGKNISPAGIEAALKTIPLVGQAMVVGDARPYVTAVLVLDPEVAAAWAAREGVTGSLAELAADPRVQAEVARAVAEANRRFSQVEHVKRFVLLGEEWLPDSDVLTPTMKLKRRGVLGRYGPAIEAMYADGGVLVERTHLPGPSEPASPARA